MEFDMSGFSDYRQIIEEKYPLPIASAFRRYRVAPLNDLGGRHKMIIDLYEVFIKYLCLIQLQEGLQTVKNFTDLLPQRDKTLEFLKRPSLGSWVGLLRIFSGLNFASISKSWINVVSQWYTESSDAEGERIISLFSDMGIKPPKQRKKSSASIICDALVTYRNKQLGHGAHQEKEVIEKKLVVLEEAILYLFLKADFLGDMNIFFTENISIDENDMWHIRGVELSGLSEEPFEFKVKDKLKLHELYLMSKESEVGAHPISLGPLIIRQMNTNQKRHELFFFNDAWKTRLEYLSYTSGTYYYHKELKEEFRDVLNLKIEGAEEDESYELLTPEERSSMAEKSYKKGKLLYSQGQLEDALLEFEKVASYERSSKIFAEIAKVLFDLNDNVRIVEHSIRKSLELDPENKDALEMLKLIENDEEERGKIDLQPTENDSGYTTLVHCLTPMFIKNYIYLFWPLILFTWYSFSASAEYLKGDYKYVFNVLGMLICTLVFTVGLPMARSLIYWLRLPLSLQLDSMRLERFEKWYLNQGNLIFGKNVIIDERFKLIETIKREKVYWSICFLWVFGLSAMLFFSSDSHNLSVFMIVKRSVDFSVLTFWLFICVRYIFFTTKFIYEYSNLSLKPMLTNINDEGMRSLGSLMTFNNILASIAYASYFIPAAYTNTSAYVFDMYVLALITIILTVWSFGMPFMVKRAARKSKSRTVHRYSEHIENAFNSFLESPDDGSLQKYLWTKENQIIIQKIGTWPLNWIQTITLVICFNFLLVIVPVFYLFVRLGLADSWPFLIR
jgi:tetratricopeptide (TPR) repeat protein